MIPHPKPDRQTVGIFARHLLPSSGQQHLRPNKIFIVCCCCYYHCCCTGLENIFSPGVVFWYSFILNPRPGPLRRASQPRVASRRTVVIRRFFSYCSSIQHWPRSAVFPPVRKCLLPPFKRTHTHTCWHPRVVRSFVRSFAGFVRCFAFAPSWRAIRPSSVDLPRHLPPSHHPEANGSGAGFFFVFFSFAFLTIRFFYSPPTSSSLSFPRFLWLASFLFFSCLLFVFPSSSSSFFVAFDAAGRKQNA